MRIFFLLHTWYFCLPHFMSNLFFFFFKAVFNNNKSVVTRGHWRAVNQAGNRLRWRVKTGNGRIKIKSSERWVFLPYICRTHADIKTELWCHRPGAAEIHDLSTKRVSAAFCFSAVFKQWESKGLSASSKHQGAVPHLGLIRGAMPLSEVHLN